MGRYCRNTKCQLIAYVRLASAARWRQASHMNEVATINTQVPAVKRLPTDFTQLTSTSKLACF